MCGITGIINKHGSEIDHDSIKKMNDAISHRGPDGEGFFYYRNVGIAHRRLSILDLSELGKQPMKYLDDIIITYNGEIYNYIELRKELSALNYKFISGTDTEVLLAAYIEWGVNCVEKFNGMWSFAIIDKIKNIVFCSRDRFGIKPFYYTSNNEQFLFGSEIKQLIINQKKRKVNKQILFDYLYFGYHHHNNNTFFENVLCLSPGHNLIYNLNENTFEIKKYYTLKINKEYSKLSFNEAEKLFEETLNNAINLRLRSDVNVGTCLSGGLDSSYIAAIASEIYTQKSTKKFMAFTAQSTEKKNDETHFAKMVVEKSNLDWKITTPNKNDFLTVVKEVIEAQEEPFGGPSIIMGYFVMRKAKEENCIVLLDGQGGDETLLGYERYYTAYISQQKGFINKIKALIEVVKNSKLSYLDILLYNIYFNNFRIRCFRQLKRHNYIKQDYKEYLNRNLIKQVAASNKDIHKLQNFELTQVQLQKLLKYEDRNSMKFSIETRVPFVDYKVVELAFSLPFSYKIKEGWSKYILRKIGENKLPFEIVWRKNKFGFEAPSKTWLSNKADLLSEIKKSSFINCFVNFNSLNDNLDEETLWKLYNTAIWAKIYNVEF